MDVTRWLLRADERGNPDTSIDRRHPGGLAWTTGNEVRPLVHGATYFTELCAAIKAMRAGDLILFTDWRGDPDERLDGAGSQVSAVLTEAAARGVIVKGLIWRSHLDKFQFSAAENRHLGEEIEAAGGECLLDMRVRIGGSHHQKMVVLRHPGRPELDVAFLGGIDLCHSRRDDAQHHGDPEAQDMADEYGSRPPWHDIQVALRGPAVGDVETTFRERWCDPSPLTRNPIHRLRDLLSKQDTSAGPLPAQLPDPPPCGDHIVQVLRTYPLRRNGYPFARQGERSIARAYAKVVAQAESLIYIEDQYLWSAEVAQRFADALTDNPALRIIAVVPMHPDQEGITRAAQTFGRDLALDLLRRAGGDRVAVYSLENEHGTPIYVHAKACIVDDRWVSIGSDNLNLRSWTYDSELACAIPNEEVAKDLRRRLGEEHLAGPLPENDDIFERYRAAAAGLDAWHANGRTGPRPAGRLRQYQPQKLSAATKTYARLLYRLVSDPDGRPRALRRAAQF